LSDDWYVLKKTTFDFLRSDGTWQTQNRETYDRGNGAAILLYNREHKTVVLIRQFRFPAYVNGLADGMLIEVCAGLLDKADPEACIKKEAEEEAKKERHVAFKDQLKPTVNSLTPPMSPAKRMRGRPKKNGNLSHSTATPSSTPLRRSTRRRAAEHESDSEDSFKPSQHVSTEIAKTEHDDDQGEEDMVADGEAAALALGLSFIGGLGTASASVLGAEIAGR